MLTVRELPPAEFSRLAHLPIGQARVLDPTQVVVLVVEDDGEIVATWAAFSVVHVDGLWIDPASRQRIGVTRRVVEGMRAALTARQVAEVVTITTAPEVATLAQKVGGTRIPGDLWCIRPSFEGGPLCLLPSRS
jgi:hypothetical protein